MIPECPDSMSMIMNISNNYVILLGGTNQGESGGERGNSPSPTKVSRPLSAIIMSCDHVLFLYIQINFQWKANVSLSYGYVNAIFFFLKNEVCCGSELIEPIT